MGFAAPTGPLAAPQASVSTRVACCPSCTVADSDADFSGDVFRRELPRRMFTSNLSASTLTVPLTSVTSYCVQSFETGTTFRQSTCALIDLDVPTVPLP